MTHDDPGLRRVSVYADTVGVDLALPAQVPVAVLLPAIVDAVAARGYRRDDRAATGYRLVEPGAGALDPAKSAAQQHLRDGAVLVLSRADGGFSTPVCDDTATTVATTVDRLARPTTPKTGRLGGVVAASGLAGVAAATLLGCACGHSQARGIGAGVAAGLGGLALIAAVVAHRGDPVIGGTLAVWAAGFAAVAGWVGVPGGPGAPNVLLAAMAAAAVAVPAMRLTGCGAVAPTAIAAAGLLVGLAAAPGVLVAVPLRATGALTAAVSVGLLQVCARVSLAAAGLSARAGAEAAAAPDRLTAQVRRAHATLTALVAGWAGTALVGAAGTAFAAQRPGAAFAATIGVVLLLRARAHTDRVQALALRWAGTGAISAAFVAAAAALRGHPLGVCAAAAALTVAALVAVGAHAPSPAARRAAELTEHLGLAAIAPLACWVCGLFDTAPALTL